MRPLTDSIPKPLIKINEKPIIDYVLERVIEMRSITTVVVNGFYLREQIREHIKKYPGLIFSEETFKLETGGGLLFAINKIDISRPILLVNADTFWFDYGGQKRDLELLCDSYEKRSDCDILLGMKRVGEVLGYDGHGDFDMDEDGALTANAARRSFVFVGVQIVNPMILNNAPTVPFSMSYFYRKACAENGRLSRVAGIELDGEYFHVGSAESLRLVTDYLKGTSKN